MQDVFPGTAVAIDARLAGGTYTGDSTYWTSLLSAWAKHHPNAPLLLFSNGKRPDGIPGIDHFRWIEVPARSSRLWSLVSFPVAARRAGARVVHTQYSLSPLVRKGGVTTIHDVSFFIGPQWFRSKDRILLQIAVPKAARRASKIIAVSETCRREIEQFVPAASGKTVAIPNACPDWIHAVSREQAQEHVRRSFGLTSPYLLTVGTRWPRKNMDLAVRASALLGTDLPHKLVITGKAGWGSTELGPRGVSVGYVSSDDLCALYSGADCYVAPSRHEGFGIPVLEAFRCGCPVVCSSGGAFPEVAADAAAVMNDWEPQSWATRLDQLLRDSSTLERMREAGRRRETRFSWARCAETTLKVYREVAESL